MFHNFTQRCLHLHRLLIIILSSVCYCSAACWHSTLSCNKNSTPDYSTNGFCAGTNVCLQRTALEDCKRRACREKLWPKVGGKAEEADSGSEMVHFLSLEAPRHKSLGSTQEFTLNEKQMCVQRVWSAAMKAKLSPKTARSTTHTLKTLLVLVVINHIVPKTCLHYLVLLLIILSLYFIMRNLS